MRRHSAALALLILITCISGYSGDLPDTPAVQAGLQAGLAGIQQRDPDAAAKGYLRAVAAASSTPETRLAVAEAGYKALVEDFDSVYFGMDPEIESMKRSFALAYWQAAVAKYPGHPMESRLERARLMLGQPSMEELTVYLNAHPDDLEVASRLVGDWNASWEVVMACVTATGDYRGVMLGLDYLQAHTDKVAESKAFQQVLLKVVGGELQPEQIKKLVDGIWMLNLTEVMPHLPWTKWAEANPEDDWFLQQIAYLPETKWEQLEPLLLARNDRSSLMLGLSVLSSRPEFVGGSTAFIQHVVSEIPHADAKDLLTFLSCGDALGIDQFEKAVLDRLANDPSPEVQQVAQSDILKLYRFGLGLVSTKKRVRELAASYDLERMDVPPVEPLTGPGYTKEAFDKVQAIAVLPRPAKRPARKEDPVLFERLAALDAIVAEQPGYRYTYRVKADILAGAGFKEEAILCLTEALRYGPDTQVHEQRAQLWSQLHARTLQALIDANYALQWHVEPEILLLFCDLGVSTLLEGKHELTAVWQDNVARQLMILEERHADRLLSTPALVDNAVLFWDMCGNDARAQAAFARYKVKYPNYQAEMSYKVDIKPLEKKWQEALSQALFYGLPQAPAPYGKELAASLEKGRLADAWKAYERWRLADPRSVQPYIHGAAIFTDLSAPYLALSTLMMAPKPVAGSEEEKLYHRIKAVAHARAGEIVAAARSQSLATGDRLNVYWLLAFTEANAGAVYSRLGERAMAVLAAEPRDAEQAVWAWRIYEATASRKALAEAREQLQISDELLAASGALKSAPTAETLTNVLTDPSQRPAFRLWSDSLVAKGSLPPDVWWFWAQLASVDGRPADAAFGAATYLLDPPDGVSAATIAEARKMVETYRDAVPASTDSRAEREASILHDPCNVEALVAAYEAARNTQDDFAAVAVLRQLHLAYADDRVDLNAACNLAVTTADWELLLSLSQTALAQDPSPMNQRWFALALQIGGFTKSAEAMEDRLYDARHRSFTEDLRRWSAFVSTTRYAYVKPGESVASDLYQALADGESLRGYREGDLTSTFAKQQHGKLEASVKNYLRTAPPSTVTHLRFVLGETAQDAYLAALSTPEDLALGRLMAILDTWKGLQRAQVDAAAIGDINGVLYDPSLPLHLRVMAYRMLVLSHVLQPLQPMRATDGLLLDDERPDARDDVRAGRLVYVLDAKTLLTYYGGTASTTYPNGYNQPVHTFKVNGPELIRLGASPDAPEQVVLWLRSETFLEKMQSFAGVSLKPAADRATTELADSLGRAGDDQQARLAAYDLAARRLGRLTQAFYLEKTTFGDAVFDAVKPYFEKYPADAFRAWMALDNLPKSRVKELSNKTRQTMKLGAQAVISAYQNKLNQGNATTSSLDEADKIMKAYPPGSPWYTFVMAKLEAGMAPSRIAGAIADSKRAAAEKAKADAAKSTLKAGNIWVSDAIEKFEKAMRFGNMSEAADMAYTLGGQYFVRWALKDQSARLDELVRARNLATSSADRNALDYRISRINRAAQRASSGYSSSSGSWSSFSAEMAQKRRAGLAAQRERDIKNNIFKHNSYYK